MKVATRALRIYTFLAVSVFLFISFTSAALYAADVGNCLLCHKYPGISRIDEEGKMKLFYVNESIFSNSVHAKVKCEGCHTEIKKIPHEPAKSVDCMVECHIIEPSSEKKFSHKDAEKFLAKSVHGTQDEKGNEKKYIEDYPGCKDCHDNPLYRPLSFFKKIRPGISEASLGRCKVCHKKDEFVYRFYNHVTTRLHKSRSPLNIAEVCARCHDNPQIVARHEFSTKAVYSYGETFHGKAAQFLDERVPDCLDCHVNKGDSVHQMLSKENPESSIHDNNRGKICTSIDCHPGASVKLGTYGVHAEFNLDQSPAQYFFTLFFIILTGGTLLPLMFIILLDIIRRFFPNASIGRRN